MSFGAVVAFVVSLVSNTIAYLIPAYLSFKSIEAHNGVETWLTYWLVLALYTVAEWWLHILLVRIFFMPTIKLAFVIWLQLPATKGAQMIYVQGILPFFKAHQSKIDKVIEDGQAKVHQKMSELGFVHSASSDPVVAAGSGFEGLSRPNSRYAATGGALHSPDLERPDTGTGKAR